jgi:hypothetical protein
VVATFSLILSATIRGWHALWSMEHSRDLRCRPRGCSKAPKRTVSLRRYPFTACRIYSEILQGCTIRKRWTLRKARDIVSYYRDVRMIGFKNSGWDDLFHFSAGIEQCDDMKRFLYYNYSYFRGHRKTNILLLGITTLQLLLLINPRWKWDFCTPGCVL